MNKELILRVKDRGGVDFDRRGGLYMVDNSDYLENPQRVYEGGRILTGLRRVSTVGTTRVGIQGSCAT